MKIFLLAVHFILLLKSLAFQHPKLPPRQHGRHISKTNLDASSQDIVAKLTFRQPLAEDIPRCFEIESASYPEDEAATLESLCYRQTQAGNYFQCTILDGKIIGFVCGTRCSLFEEEAMSMNVPTGKLLAVHSVVVHEDYRRRGIASAMLKRYVEKVQVENIDGGIESIVLLAKSNLLGFYVKCGFQVIRPSPIIHGKDLWFELEKRTARGMPLDGKETWFCKTETFSKPFTVVKPFLQAHIDWVTDLRRKGYCITSGYRVDSEGKPGGGGLMFLAAKSYDEARKLVLEDPLVKNDCVDWELNGWIGQVGDIQMR